MRWTLICAALVGLALLLQDESGETATARTTALAGGSLSLSNSLSGSAIFTADNVAPGDSAGGAVTLTNTGSLAGALSLSKEDLTDVPGLGGGRLSERLDLFVSDVSTPSSSAPLYVGKLAAMPVLALGPLPAGASRTFVFTALLPERADDNAHAGALMTVRYAWTATDDAAATPLPKPPARDLPPRIRLRVPRMQRIVTRARFRAFASCNEPCRITAYVNVPSGAGRRMRTDAVKTRRLRARRRALLRIRLPRRSAMAIGRALRRGAPTGMTLTVMARDDAGNTRIVKRKVVFRLVSARRAR